MTDQPKPTPGPWKLFDGWGAKALQPIIVDSIPDVDGKCVANCICYVATTNPDALANAALIARAPELQQRVDELTKMLTIDGIEDLIKARDELTAENQRLKVEACNESLAYLADNNRLIAENDELQSAYTDAAKDVAALVANLADYKQLLQIKNRQLDTMAQDNQRLRELLRRWMRAQASEDRTIWIDTNHAIGRAGE